MEWRTRSGECVERLRVLPGDRLSAATCIAKGETQPWLTVFLAPQLALANRVDAADTLAILKSTKGHPCRNQRVGEGLLFHLQSKVMAAADDLVTSHFLRILQG
jgi:hypothetical protein